MPSEPGAVIDTHNHYWQVGVDDLYWLDDPTHPVLGKDYLPPDLKPHMDAVGVTQSVIVQASHAWKDQLAYLEMAFVEELDRRRAGEPEARICPHCGEEIHDDEGAGA